MLVTCKENDIYMCVCVCVLHCVVILHFIALCFTDTVYIYIPFVCIYMCIYVHLNKLECCGKVHLFQ